MIERYRDHAANERTYLAWVRTGITVMVLGVIIEKFEIFLAGLTGLVTQKAHQAAQSAGAQYTSVALVVLGVVVILGGALRFFRIKRELSSEQVIQYKGTAFCLSLTVVLVAFGGFLILYLARVI